jgi:histidine phosphotransferase ChpT
MLITLNLVGWVWRWDAIFPNRLTASDMLIDTASLVALVSSRICHDLISPFTALTTALDVLDDDHGADMREQAMDLIRTSSGQARVKLEFMRTAFGSATIGTGDADMGEIRSLSENFFQTQKPSLLWSLSLPNIPVAGARLLMHLLLVALDCLPRGGEVVVSGGQEDEKLILSVCATGPRAAIKPAVRASLAGDTPEGGFDVRSIQPYLVFLTASGSRAELAARESDERVEIIVRMMTT